MPRQPVEFEFRGAWPAAAAEAASRRRLRALEASYPSIQRWDVQLRPLPDGAEYEAQVRAAIVGGDTFAAQGRGSDALGALRLAFNTLEARLASEHENVHARTAEWVSKVKTRLGLGRPEA